MTPIGHLSMSYISGRLIRNICLPAIMIGGVLPDIDVLFILFDWFNKVHRVVTHNFLFVVLTAVFGSLLVSRSKMKSVGLSLFLGGLSHLLIDSCMDINPTNGIGVALLWPFYEGLFSPFNLLSISQKGVGWNDPLNMIISLVPSMLYEAPFYAVSVILYIKRPKKRIVPDAK